MSHFIIGKIETRSPGARSFLAQRLVQVAAVKGLVVRLLDETNAQLQYEILSAAGLGDGSDVVFFDIVGPSGTADELISPYVLIDQWPQSIKVTIGAISKLASELLLNHDVHEVTVVFSEGYDIQYESHEVDTESMTDLLMEKFTAAGEVPSLAVRLTR